MFKKYNFRNTINKSKTYGTESSSIVDLSLSRVLAAIKTQIERRFHNMYVLKRLLRYSVLDSGTIKSCPLFLE